MKTYSGDKEIFDSGLVIAFKNEPILIQLTPTMKITISFIDDKSDAKQRIEPKPKSEDELELKLINFNNSMGTGTTEPMRLGTIDNRYLYLNFFVYSLGLGTQKTFQYTWYLGEEVKHG